MAGLVPAIPIMKMKCRSNGADIAVVSATRQADFCARLVGDRADSPTSLGIRAEPWAP